VSMIRSLHQLKIIQLGLLAMLFVGGMYSFIKAPQQTLPNIQDKRIVIDVFWPRQPANNVESQITSRLENRLTGLEYLKKTTSFSTNGLAHIELFFKSEGDLTQLLNQVNTLVTSTQGLPDDIERPSVLIRGGKSSLAATLVVTSPVEDIRWTNVQKNWDSVWIPKLRSIDGIKNVSMLGRFKPQLVIKLDKRKLQHFTINPSDILNLIRFKFSPLSSSELSLGKRKYSIFIDTNLSSLDDLENILIQENIDGMVFLKDLANISLGYNKNSVLAYIDGHPGMVLSISAAIDADLPSIMTQVRDINEQYNASNITKNDTISTIFYDASLQLTSANNDLWLSLSISCVISFICIYLLMGKAVKVAFLVFMAIPFSFLSTNLLLLWLGHSHNMLVLAGLAFASGLVVDNAIVVAEAIHSNLEKKMPLVVSIRKALESIAVPIGAGTVTTIIAMVPILFVSEGAGLLIRDMIIPMIASIAFSFFYAILVIPVFMDEKSQTASLRSFISVGFDFKDIVVNILTLLLTVLLSVYIIIIFLPTPGFLPDSKTNLIKGNIFPDPSLNMSSIQNFRVPLEKIVNRILNKEDNSASFIYLSSPNTPPSFTISANSEYHAAVVNKSLNEHLLPDAFMSSYQQTILPVEKSTSITLHVQGENFRESSKLALRIWQSIPNILPGSSVSYPWVGVNSLQKKLLFDQNKLFRAGFNQAEIASNIAVYTNELLAFKAVLKQKSYDVMLSVNEDEKADNIDHLSFFNKQGSLYNLWQLSKQEVRYIAGYIPHLNGKRVISITLNLPPEINLGEAKDIIDTHLLKLLNIPSDINIIFDENISEFDHFKTQTLELFILALIFIYIVLVTFFSNFKTPLLLIFSTLFAIAGGVLGVLIGEYFWAIKFNLLTAIGFIMLIGIVINNSILVVKEVINIHNLNKGDTINSIINKAVLNRFRPILITTLTTIIGFLPLIIHSDFGSALYVGIALVLIMGLLTSIFSSLYLLPIAIKLLPFMIFSKKTNTSST
jgi:HAE1 family hydrophobic/amphiphilic exporter-1